MLGLHEQRQQTPTNHIRNISVDITKQSHRDSLPGGYPPGAEPFLSAIIAQREDDTPRLVFADWLQENGDEDRAEFIRLQIALARAQPYYEVDQKQWATDTHENRTRNERQQTLLAANLTAWCAQGQRTTVYHFGDMRGVGADKSCD